ncbi:hypothetical protein Niako_3088 [Niastella koreensis GR20-10]|uniref:RagB/SusD domain-containing protein n=2 Tax=Niastella koreensis TaxID=354356 RepID=G8TEJ6_NIAKG|nr:hypothetical protein Niako_3088 [Niastella koreensis GR20-10]
MIILFLILVTGGVAACKKWVNVDAPLQVNEKTVFASEQGFRDILNGVYLKMGDSTLYGRELTYGLLSVLGRSYDTTISPAIRNIYYQGVQYNFQDNDVRAVMAGMWSGMYQCIANLNYLLTNIETHQTLLGNSYSAIKGEALGLRAFLYSDLVRLFAPAPAVDPDGASVPYITQLSPYGSVAMPTSAVIDSCIADLVTAQSLLPATDANVSHITGASVKALLARLYLYKGDLLNAQSYALGLINSKQFPLYTANPGTTTANDYMFQKEHLFSLYANQGLMFSYTKYILTAVPALGLAPQSQTALFVTGAGALANDWRKTFADPATGATTGTVITPRKFSTSIGGYTGFNVLPMIRITEMYYIAAECATAFKDSLAATNLLDSVRTRRGLQNYGYVNTTNPGTGTKLRTDSLTKEIAREYQKEFLGEGQVFYYYKRKNLPFSTLPFTRVPTVAGASYVFIKPE